MNSSDSDLQPDTETLEHLLGVVVDNREKRCQDIRDRAREQAAEIIGQAYTKGRARLHRHVDEIGDARGNRISPFGNVECRMPKDE